MKILLITVAGLSSRFSESVGRECLKCIYYENSIEDSLLYQLLHMSDAFDKYILVGGFRYEELQASIQRDFEELQDKIILVENTKYREYGSGYSLYLGLEAAQKLPCQGLVFAEGDLYLDKESFERILASDKNVITYNRDPIWANKAVAFYFDRQRQVHYIYDTSHNTLEIQEPFLGIFNSGQVWKFKEADRVRNVMASMNEINWQGTNLVFVQRYFEQLSEQDYEMIGFEKWINCNTVLDFRKI